MEESDWFTDGATAAQLNSVGQTVYSAAGAHTGKALQMRGKGLFLDLCVVAEIAKEENQCHFAVERGFGEVVAPRIWPSWV